MSLYNIIDKHMLLPIGDMVYRSNINTQWERLKRTEFVSKTDLTELQNTKLRKLIHHCYNTVPYYHELFCKLNLSPTDIQCQEDLCKLPVLTKQTIRDNYESLFSTTIDKRYRRTSSTGGSTGTPLQFCTDKREWSLQRAATLRAWDGYGIHLGDRIFSLGGSSITSKREILSLKGIYDLVIMRNHKYSSSAVDDISQQKHLEAFHKIKPKAIRGYGSSLVVFARYLKKIGYSPENIIAVLTTGEVLLPTYRKELEDVFNAPVYDAYGASDGGIVSHECQNHNGLHISEELCIIEITDKLGNRLPDGDIGFVTTTDLENYVFPFLRYHVGDMSYIKQKPCTCGRHSRQLGEVMGRAGKLLYNKQGVPLSPTMLPIMLYPDLNYHSIENQKLYNQIDQFQIRQDILGNIHILLKMKNPYKDTPLRNSIIENYKKHFTGSDITLEIVDTIPTLPSGKEDYCVSEYEQFSV